MGGGGEFTRPNLDPATCQYSSQGVGGGGEFTRPNLDPATCQ